MKQFDVIIKNKKRNSTVIYTAESFKYDGDRRIITVWHSELGSISTGVSIDEEITIKQCEDSEV